MLALIEELQVRGNRMEAAIDDNHDLEAMLDERRELRKELEDLQKKIKKLKKQLPEKSE
jgi:cell division septum initiation protein DivIVA